MKIGFITDKFHPEIGGPYSILKETVKHLSKKKIDIKLIYIKKKKSSLINIIKKLDICHFYGGWTYFHIKSVIIALKLKKKIIIHPLGFYEPWSLGQKKIKKFIAWHIYQKKILKIANMIHCASRLEEKNLLNLCKDFKTVVIPYGIPNSFILKNFKKSKFKKKALFFSRLHKKKGIETLIKVWQDINDNQWQLDIVGPCNNKTYVDKLIKLSNNNPNINFLKPIYKTSSKKKLFSKYDFFVLPTYSENFGIVILESLARGLPVLTTPKTPWSDIKKFNAGWVVDNNYSNLTFVLKKIFKSPCKILNIKSKNAIRLSQKYNWNRLVFDYLNIYKKLINT
jgi:glycosyltransferase involved in cell wall biosynthesis